jgi:hypothetical protein
MGMITPLSLSHHGHPLSICWWQTTTPLCMLNNEFATGFNKFGNHEFLVGITFHSKMINYHEFPFLLGITFHGKMTNYHEFPFLVGITFHGKMINYHEFPFLLGITFHGKIINYHEFPFPRR